MPVTPGFVSHWRSDVIPRSSSDPLSFARSQSPHRFPVPQSPGSVAAHFADRHWQSPHRVWAPARLLTKVTCFNSIVWSYNLAFSFGWCCSGAFKSSSTDSNIVPVPSVFVSSDFKKVFPALIKESLQLLTICKNYRDIFKKTESAYISVRKPCSIKIRFYYR